MKTKHKKKELPSQAALFFSYRKTEQMKKIKYNAYHLDAMRANYKKSKQKNINMETSFYMNQISENQKKYVSKINLLPCFEQKLDILLFYVYIH